MAGIGPLKPSEEHFGFEVKVSLGDGRGCVGGRPPQKSSARRNTPYLFRYFIVLEKVIKESSPINLKAKFNKFNLS